ncbi:MAG TPA: trehalose-phosphatase, partial [Nannocystis sp.]
INGRWATLTEAPIHYIYRGLPQDQLVRLYRAADVMLVTPNRDGMNLVAKEFVAARTDGDGVLVLSEFAGAAEEMPEALQINPFDVDGMARAIEQALDMPEAERRTRMSGLRARVLHFDVHRWAEDFLAALADPALGSPDVAAPRLTPAAVAAAAREAVRAGRRVVLVLDYDGTLVPIVRRPDLAAPDPDLLELLEELSQKTCLLIHVVSGRPCAEIERWLGHLPIGLHAEHGMFTRVGGRVSGEGEPIAQGAEWRQRSAVPEDLREKVLALLERVSACTPGSHVEVKAAGLAWHYRQAEREQGAHQARELRLHLRELLVGTPLEVLGGDKVVEIRPRGVHKGLVLRETLLPDDLVIAIGDDRTDEDLFVTAPEGALTAKVGPGPSAARFRVPDVAAVRAILRALADALEDAQKDMSDRSIPQRRAS